MDTSINANLKALLNDRNVKLDAPYMDEIFRKNHTILDEFSTKWNLPFGLNQTDLHHLCMYINWATDHEKFINISTLILSELLRLNPELENLIQFVTAPKPITSQIFAIRDIIGGVAANLNLTDIRYFLEVPYHERPTDIQELGEIAKSACKLEIETDNDIQSLHFLLSRETCERILEKSENKFLTLK